MNNGAMNRWRCLTSAWLALAATAGAAMLRNSDFETGDLTGWDVQEGPLAVAAAEGETFNREYAARISGTHDGGEWITNGLSQTVPMTAGDRVRALGFVYWEAADYTSPAGQGYVEARLEGPAGLLATQIWTQVQDGWRFFELEGACTGAENSGFESGQIAPWNVGADDLDVTLSRNAVYQGDYALRFNGTWDGWSWNQAYQVLELEAGDVVHARAWMHVAHLVKIDEDTWAAAGIKLEQEGGPDSWENVMLASYSDTGWVELSFSTEIAHGGEYVFRCMVCGGEDGLGEVAADVYFDDVRFWKEVDGSGETGEVTVSVSYIGTAGGEGESASILLQADGITLAGSGAESETLDEFHAALLDRAAETVGSGEGIPPMVYPPLFSHGLIGDDPDAPNFSSRVEAAVAGWRFRFMTNLVPVTLTNRLSAHELEGNGPGVIEFDQYLYCARNWNHERGEPLDILTNAPYWTLGERDGRSDEFGAGPFPEVHTYTLGDPLSQFPRRLVTHYDGVWPTTLDVVFPENLGLFNRDYDKYFVLAAVTNNGPADNVKTLKLGLKGTDPAGTNLVFESMEIHMGWASEEESRGKVDYPNVTYQSHNEVVLRAPYLYGLVDRDGWFAQPVARGSATIEPIALHARDQGGWRLQPYEEYLYTWPNAASGVRSIFDDDETDRIPGSVSYPVGFKVGHQRTDPETGEINFPGLIEIRGNGYFRMTDYDGVMGGSMRPVSADIFGIHQYAEDAPLIPAGYLALLPRTTPPGGPDDSLMRMFLPIRSKTNEWFTGVIRTDAFFVPEQVENEGVYLEMETDLVANRALNLDEHGPLNLFAQVNMFWRGGLDIGGGYEGHDHDTIMIQKADGEWISHRSINPPTNILHRTLGTLRSNDVVYIRQQDRGADSYGFATEAPYRRVSHFEFTVLDDGGRNLALDVFEQNTFSEINDNVVVAGALHEDLARGEHVHARLRYRSVYAPGVVIHHPRTPDGGGNWGDNRYVIEASATDGHDKPLEMSLFYGSGKDGEWIPIHAGILPVPTNTHRVIHDWDVSAVPPGAYYIRAEARRIAGGKTGFDVSPGRLQVGPVMGFPFNGETEMATVTNGARAVGINLGFETGNTGGWFPGSEHLTVEASEDRAWSGAWSARMHGSWSGWSWNNLRQAIPCRSGEILRVKGRVFIDALEPGGADWLAGGIKMESTNSLDPSFSGVEFTAASHGTGEWFEVAFERVAPVTGEDYLFLWVAGHDGADVDVYFDGLEVHAGGTVSTTLLQHVHWTSSVPVDVSAYDALMFTAAMDDGADTLQIWAADADGNRQSLDVSAYAAIGSLAQPVSIPWSDFDGIDRTRLSVIGFNADSSGPPQINSLRAAMEPFAVRAEFLAPPMQDADGLPHYNPGQTVLQTITVSNPAATDIENVNLQLLQEYAEDTAWLDRSPHVEERWSDRTRKGDRLAGAFERRWTGVTIPAGGAVVLTNEYVMPEGRLIDHTRFAIPSSEDWYIGRNADARAQVRLVIRTPAGDNLFDHNQIASYSMDDDFDLDNDGIPDDWEGENDLDPTVNDANDDPDLDGFTNGQEYVGDTDPKDGTRYPRVAGLSVDADARIAFDSSADRVYTLYWCTNLIDGTWSVVPGMERRPGQGGPDAMLHSHIEPRNAFYHLRVTFP